MRGLEKGKNKGNKEPKETTETKGMGRNVYMKRTSVEVLLKECVDKIDWGVDWETLKIKWN